MSERLNASELVLRFENDEERRFFVGWLIDGGGENLAGYSWPGGKPYEAGQPITVRFPYGTEGRELIDQRREAMNKLGLDEID